ncbi:MAG: protein translocase subunit SecD [Candidatus Melainabacteria bacterium]
MFNNPKVVLLIILAIVVGALVTVFKQPPRLGLDLKGGSRLTLEALPTADVPKITPQVMKSLHFVLEKRVNGMGIGEAVVQRAGEKRMIVEIPGVKDPAEARKMLGRVGNLEFRRQENGVWVSSGVSGKDLEKAEIGNTQNGEWLILFTLKSEGARKFGDLTAEMAPNREPLGIFFDGEMISAPHVQSAILQGSGQITGSFKQEEAQQMVDILNAGALPVNIEVVQENTVGPLLGEASIRQSIFAGLVGLGLVCVFMLAYYRLNGLVADIALLLYTVMTYAAFILFGVTFTLAGIAGFILSIGMAVDANILIFERTKEELQHGRSTWKAIEVGFDRAFPSIFDSNMTTLLTCAILWWLGTGAVKGFALTLAIGVVISMFTAITVTKNFLFLVNSTMAPPQTQKV